MVSLGLISADKEAPSASAVRRLDGLGSRVAEPVPWILWVREEVKEEERRREEVSDQVIREDPAGAVVVRAWPGHRSKYLVR